MLSEQPKVSLIPLLKSLLIRGVAAQRARFSSKAKYK
jgi:hypothetical protein